MRKRIICLSIVAFFCILLNGFYKETPSSGIYKEASSRFPASYMVEKENYFDYQSGPECAAYASAYLLRHNGTEASGLELYQDFPGKIYGDGGVFPHGIVTFFKDQGYSAEFICDSSVDDLKQEISKGAPVIVFIHGRSPYTSVHDTHYVPLVGYDETYFYFAESVEDLANCKNETGLLYNRKTTIHDFLNLWGNIDGNWEHPYFSISAPDASGI